MGVLNSLFPFLSEFPKISTINMFHFCFSKEDIEVRVCFASNSLGGAVAGAPERGQEGPLTTDTHGTHYPVRL